MSDRPRKRKADSLNSGQSVADKKRVVTEAQTKLSSAESDLTTTQCDEQIRVNKARTRAMDAQRNYTIVKFESKIRLMEKENVVINLKRNFENARHALEVADRQRVPVARTEVDQIQANTTDTETVDVHSLEETSDSSVDPESPCGQPDEVLVAHAEDANNDSDNEIPCGQPDEVLDAYAQDANNDSDAEFPCGQPDELLVAHAEDANNDSDAEFDFDAEFDPDAEFEAFIAAVGDAKAKHH